RHKILNGRWVIHSLYRRGGFWRGRVRDLKTNRLYQPGTREGNHRRAEQAILDWIKLFEAREARKVEPLTERFDARFTEWLGLKTLRHSTKVDRESAFKGIFKPWFGDQSLDQITAKDVERFLKHLETQRKCAAKTRRKHLITLRGFFQWGVRH